ncbi:hypothetical protein F4861DRAFT_543638 [Xylaria intraflava]|nr:hypothetical protein F4861DRAFT_543638 [Xylaria intraflava]
MDTIKSDEILQTIRTIRGGKLNVLLRTPKHSLPRFTLRRLQRPWVLRTEDQHPVEKEILPLDPNTCLSDWEETLWPGFYRLLDSSPAKEFWNCVDIIKMRTSGGADSATVIWIGVEAGLEGAQISYREGFSVCSRGHEFLESQLGRKNTANIRVEMRRTGIINNNISASKSVNLLTG